MAIEDLVNLSSSLELRLFQVLQQAGMTIPYQGITLSPVTAPTILATSGDLPVPPNTFSSPAGKPISFWNSDTSGTSNSRVQIYVGGTLQDPSTYTVNYRQGWITFASAPAGPVTATIETFAAHVLSAYPDQKWLEQNDLPIISFNSGEMHGRGFGVGTVARVYNYPTTLDILGTNDVERQLYISILCRYMLFIPLWDLRSSNVFLANGDLNPSFDYQDQWIDTLQYHTEPTGRTIPRRTGGFDKEKYRAIVLIDPFNIW